MAAIRGRGNKDTELRMVALLRAHGIAGCAAACAGFPRRAGNSS